MSQVSKFILKNLKKLFLVFLMAFALTCVFACDKEEETPLEPTPQETPEEVKYVVTFDVDGAKETIEVKEGEKATKPADPVKDGFTFLGWYLGDAAYDFETAVNANITLVAKFEEAKQPTVEVKYVVTFDVDGVVTTAEVKEGEKATKPADPVKDGFTFLGWYLGDAAYDFETAVNANITLVAKFEEVVLEVESVTIEGPAYVRVDKTATYTAVISPAGAEGTVVWSVSDEAIATIDENGLLTPVAVGDVKVIATVNEVASELEVRVQPKPKVDPEDIILVIDGVEYENGATIDITEFDEIKLEFKYLPADEEVNEGVDISSSNEDYLIVDAEGNLKAVAPGMAYIEVAALYADVLKAYYFNVAEKHFVPESITVECQYPTIEVNEEAEMKATVAPERASQEVKWVSSDETIAVVDPVSGVVTGKGIGKVVIKAISTEIETVVGEYEIEVIAEVPVDRSVVYVGLAYTEKGAAVTIDGKEYIVGKNAYASLSQASKGVAEGGEVRIEAGVYEEEVKIVKGAKFIALGEVELTKTIVLANSLSGLELNGIKFTGEAAIVSNTSGDSTNTKTEELFENIVVKNCNFEDVGAGDDATFHIYGIAKNVVFEGNTFYFGTYRGVRFENVLENLTFVNNTVTGKSGVLYDALRGMGTVCGEVVVSNNVFDTCVQSMIQFANVTGVSTYTFEKNVFKNVGNASIDIRLYTGDATAASIKYVIRFNEFLDSGNTWGTIRLRAGGLTVEQISAEINYNKFANIALDPTEKNANWLVQQAGGAVEFNYINADYNYYDQGEYQDNWVQSCASHEGWYLDVAVIDAIIAEGKAPEEVVEITEADKALLQQFADEMVALFNNAEIDGKVETTQDNFTGSTHPNVKGAFGTAENLAKYKWFLEFMLKEYSALADASGASGLPSGGSLESMKEMLTAMINGDTAAISGSYADGRTCFRQFIHRLINAYNANATAGNASYNSFTVDFANEPAKLKEFLELYKANSDQAPEVKYVVTFDNEGVLETVEVVEGEKATKPLDPVKEGYVFLGWYLGEEAYDFEAAVTSDVTLVAKYEVEVVLADEATVDANGEVKTIAEALALVKAGGTITVKAGEYAEDVKIEKAITIVGEEGAVLTGVVELAANDITLKGLKFTAGSPLCTNVAVENITVDSCVVEAAAAGNADGMFQFNAYVTNFVAKDCSFTMISNRGIRFEVGAKDVEIVNCLFLSNGAVYDHVRFQGAATGNVTIANCTFTNSNQSFVYSHNITGAEVNFLIKDNTFTDAANVAIDLRTHNGEAATAKVTYDILCNSFTGAYTWGTIRLRAAGLTAENVKANINYNKFLNIALDSTEKNANWYVQQAGGTVEFNYINADYNYSTEGAYQSNWVQNCASAEGWFESEEALAAAIEALNIKNVTVAEALEIGAPLGQNVVADGTYRLTGVIVSVTNEKYGNVYISDDNFKSQILVYGIDGYSSLEYKPVAGDTVTLVSQISNFAGTAQLKNAKLESYEKGVLEVAVDPNGEVKTIAEALAIVNWGGTITLAAGTYTETVVIEKAVTILGPNAGKSGLATDRAEEAVIDASIVINAEGVTIDGVKLEANANIEFAAGKAKVANVYSLASNCIVTSDINRTAVLYATTEVSDIEVVDSYFNIGDQSYLKGVWASAKTVSNVTFEGNYFTHNNTDNSSISDCIAMYRVGGELNFVNNHFVWVTDDWDLFIGYNANYCTVINIIENTFDGVGELYTCGNTIRNLEPTAVVNIVGNTFNTLSGTILSSNGSVEGATINVKYNAYMNCSYKQGTAGSATFNHENNYYALEQKTATSDYGTITSKEALDAAYNASKENTVKLVLADAGYANAQDFTSHKIGDVTVTASQENGTSSPKYYDNGTNLRVYTNNKVTFKADAGYAVKSVIVEFTSSYEVNDECTLANCSYEVVDGAYVFTPVDGAAEFSFQNTKESGQIRITAITVVYGAA